MSQMISMLQAQFFALDGKPLAGGTVRVYEAGTVTPKVTYNSSACTVQNVWPVVLDYAGRADIYVQGDCRIQVFDRLGVLIEETDELQDISQLVTEADEAALEALQAQISAIYDAGSGNAVLQNATYENGVLSYTGGTIQSIPAMTMIFPLSVAAGGVLTMSAGNSGLLYVAVVSGPVLPPSAPTLAITVGTDSIGVYDTSYPVLPGTAVPLQWTDHSISAQIGGEWRTLNDAPLADPHVLFFKVGGGTLSPVSIAVDGLVPGAGPSGFLHQEIQARQAADAALSLEIANKADQYALDALAGTVADVQTLAQVNQLNITEKADQVDLDTLQTTVNGWGLTILQKADWSALDALGAYVNTKATPADITAAIANLVNGAPDALNTLSEIATALAGEQAQIADLLSALALRVRVDAVQSLTLAQQLQARQNINAEAVGVAAGLVAAITPASIGAATAVQGAKADTALQSADLAPVAFSGAYSALTGLPSIPGLSSSTPAAPTTGGTAGTATTAARGDHAHPLPTSAQITAAVLTGLASGSATAIAAADTLIQALEKLQAQISARGLTNLVEVLNTSAPNATVPVVGWTPNRSEANVDLVLSPKGTGAITANVPDSTVTGGNKRGIGAVDLQMIRTAATQVASGNYSVALGGLNIASGAYSVALGQNNTASGSVSAALGSGNIASGNYSVALGGSNTASGNYSVALGLFANTRLVPSATAQGWSLNLTGFSSTVAGSFQSAVYPLWNGTNDATPVSLFAGTISSVDRYPVIPDRHGWSFEATVCARSPSDFVVWDIRGMVVCDASGVASLVGTPTITKRGETSAVSWSVAVGIKTVAGGKAVDFIVTGAASTKIAWNATMRTIETFCQ